MSKSLFCVHAPSQKIFLATLRCFSVQLSFTLFRKRASPGSSHAPSFNSSFSCFATHFFKKTERALCTSIFLTSFGHKSRVNCYLTSEDQRVPIPPFYSQVTGLTTSLLLQALSPVSTFGPPGPASSMLLFARLLPKTEQPWWRALPPLQGHMHP